MVVLAILCNGFILCSVIYRYTYEYDEQDFSYDFSYIYNNIGYRYTLFISYTKIQKVDVIIL